MKILLLAPLALMLGGCVGTLTPSIDPLEPLPTLAPYVPDDMDRSARDLAAEVLLDDGAALERSLGRISDMDGELLAAGRAPSGLLPYALDARNATIADSRVRRVASRALLERSDIPAALRKRVTEEVEDDPLALARQRLRDRFIFRYGRVANSMMESMGRSVGGVLLPYRLAQSVIHIALAEHLEDELTTGERQALAHWKRFVRENPRAPEARELLKEIHEAQLRWSQTRRDLEVRNGRKALDAGAPMLAAAYARRALRYAPEDPEATEINSIASKRVAAWRADRVRAEASAPGALADAGRQAELARALLKPSDRSLSDAASLAREILAEGPDAPLAGEARYILALAAGSRGVQGERWELIEQLAAEDNLSSGMVRYARSEWDSYEMNPYRGFEHALAKIRSERIRAMLFGPLMDGPRDRNLPRWLEYVVEIPTTVTVLIGLPMRLLQAPFESPPLGGPAVLARRTLEREPAGSHTEQTRRWLVDFERGRGNAVGALTLLETAPGSSPGELAELLEAAGDQAYDASLKEKRRDVRIRLLQDAARRFAGTEGGQKAGEAAREELRTATSQHIRISRGFLLENPDVAGPEGLALRPALLDEEPDNGELHPEGVTLLGERVLEIAMLDGRPSQPPQRQRRRVSEERMARLVAQLEEATLHTLLTDRDARVEHDADRDLYFERARLRSLERADGRPHAESDYTFLGMRERYGLVRGRESILPVQLVLQGSFEDFALGAFPRVRMPKTTPDAFLYQDR
ncbi:MAG: hypothetical protein GY723_22855 [bacterium]|nr:hypothetical protein [bacterium]